MLTERKALWKHTPGMCEEVPTITSYISENKKTDAAVVIFPGGGYEKEQNTRVQDMQDFWQKTAYVRLLLITVWHRINFRCRCLMQE